MKPPGSGLSAQEAAARLARDGPNAISRRAGTSVWLRLARQFHDPLIYLLLVALALDLGHWAWSGAAGLPFEGLAIGLILLLNAGLGLYQEGRAERSLAALSELAAPRSWALRDGELVKIPARDLVEGDWVRLEAGDRVPADGRLQGAGVRVDESLLTGESVPVDRAEAEELSGGTLVVRGSGWLEVSRTGPRSALGRLADLLQGVEAGATPLEKRLARFGKRVVTWVLLLALVILAAGLAIEGLDQFGRVVLFAVALAVAAVPEGLPAVMTLTLSLGVERMARRNAVVRRLSAVEALGSVTVVASDKTGTLTTNTLRVHSLTGPDPDRALRACVLACDADSEATAGDPLELALLALAQERGLDEAAVRAAATRQSETPFDSVRKYMRATVLEDGASVSYLKGAPEVVLDRCALTPAERARWADAVAAGAAEGRKVLALAWGEGERDEGLALAGIVQLWDPPRPEARAAVERCRSAGIRVLMITGDHPATASAIARQVGLPAGDVVTGEDLLELDDAGLTTRLETANVFARVAPEHKLRLVELLQAQGEVVAMTGDGVNDAPALKRADIGVVMGRRGSDVAREAGDLILLDDDFATLVAAVEEGRSIDANIQKFIRFLFATNLSELLVVIAGTIGAVLLALRAGDGALLLPLTAAMILWINLVTDSVPAMALALDRNPGVLDQPPHPPERPLLDARSVWFVLGAGAILAAVTGALLLGLPALGWPRATARALAFHVLVCGQLLAAFQSRRLHGPAPTNPAVSVAIGVAILLQLGLAAVPSLHPFFGLVPVAGAQLVVSGLAGLAAIVLALEILTRALRPPPTP